MRIIVKDLLPGSQYHLQFRSKNIEEISEWSRTFSVRISDQSSRPLAPENVSLEVVGDSFHARWNQVQFSTDGSAATDLTGYVLQFRNVNTGQVATFETADTNFELTYNLNIASFTPVSGLVGVKVAAKNNLGNQSDWSDEIIAQNPPPGPVRNLSAEGIIGGIAVKWDAPEGLEEDFREYRAFTGLDADFEVTPPNLFWRGVGTVATYYDDVPLPRYIKVVAVDKFESMSEVSSVGPVTPISSTGVDTDAPDTPTNLDGDIDGNVLTVTWTAPANPDNDLAGYQIGYRPVGQTGWSYATASHEDSSVVITPITRFVDYEIRIRAHDFSFNYSNWSANVAVDGEVNVAPAVPAGLSMKPGITSVMLVWDRNTEEDFKEYEVQFGTAEPTEASPIYTTSGTAMSFSQDIAEDTTYYARIRAVDIEGLKSNWSTIVSGTPGLNIPIWAIGDGELDSRLMEAESNLDQAEANIAAAQETLDQAFPAGAFDVEGRFGQTVKNSVIEYAVNNSEVNAPTTGWSASQPTRTPGSFIWFRTVITYGDNTTAISSPALMTGNTGPEGSQGDPGSPGEDGAAGVSVTSVTPFFRAVTKGAAAPAQPSGTGTPSGWSTTEPAYNANTELYRADRVLYSNSTATWTPVTKVASYAGIDAAMQAANGKNAITYSDIARGATIPTAPSTSGRVAGDTHRVRYTDNGEIAKEYRLGGSPLAWQEIKYGDAIFTSIDVGKITGGSAAFDQFVANNIVARVATIIELDTSRLRASTATINEAVIEKLWTDVVRSRKITTDMMVIGSGENMIPWDPRNGVEPHLSWNATSLSATNDPDLGWVAQVEGGNGTDGVNATAMRLMSGRIARNGRIGAFDVKPGSSYRFRGGIGVGGSMPTSTPRNARLYLLFHDDKGASVTGSWASETVPGSFYGTLPDEAWIDHIFTVPAGAATVDLYLQKSWWSSGSMFVVNPQLTSAIDASLIVDGGIKARNIDISDLTSNNAFISNLVVTTANITDLTFDKIDGGTGIIKNVTVKSSLTLGDSSTDGIIRSFGYTASGSSGFLINKSGITIKSGSISAAALNIQAGQNIIPPFYSDFEAHPDLYGTGISVAGGSANNSYRVVSGGRFNKQHLEVRAVAANAMRFRMTDSPTGFNIPVEEGGTYIVSAYVRGGSSTTTGSQFRFLCEWSNGATHYPHSAVIIAPDSAWQRVSAEFTVPSGVSSMLISIYSSFSAVGQGYDVDGLQVEPKIGNSSTPSPWSPGTSTTIDGGIIRTGEIRSNTNISVNGSQQPMWSINMNGGMQIGSALIRGSVIVGTTTDSDASYIKSANFVPAQNTTVGGTPGNPGTGFLLRGSDGYAEFKNLKIAINSSVAGELVVGDENVQYTRMDYQGFASYIVKSMEGVKTQAPMITVGNFGKNVVSIADRDGNSIAGMTVSEESYTEGTSTIFVDKGLLYADNLELNENIYVSGKAYFNGPAVSPAHDLLELGPVINGQALFDTKYIEHWEQHPSLGSGQGWIQGAPFGNVMIARGNGVTREADGLSHGSEQEHEIIKASFIAQAGRAYRITLAGFGYRIRHASTRPTGQRAGSFCFYRSATAGGNVTAAGTPYKLFHFVNNNASGYQYHHETFNGHLYLAPGVDGCPTGEVTILVSGVANSDTIITFYNESTEVIVEDIGMNMPNQNINPTGVRTGSTYSGTGAPPPKTAKEFTKTYNSSWTQVWNPYGIDTLYHNNQLVGGLSVSNNQYRSYAGFPSWTSDLSGATIKKIEVYLYKRWTSYNGKKVRLGLHGNASSGSTEPTMTQVTTVTNWSDGTGKWITIPSTYHAGFKSGTYRGISVGRRSSTPSDELWSELDRHDDSTTTRPKVRITYSKVV